MRRPLVALAAVAALAAGALAAPSASAAEPYTVTALNFAVKVGPNGDQACNVVGDLYLPRTASTSRRVPAILTTNGFGGSKADQAGTGRYFASRGYAVLSYSGLGFGGSGCKITLDDPDYDGKAASQLISYLAGQGGIAFTDAAHTTAAPRLGVVKLDRSGDPRVGMIGVSYGGGIQFATASIDKRLDTIIPGATWNDLSYSLAPNNTAQTQSSGVSTSTPGAAKLLWALGFVASGAQNGLQNAPADPGRLIPCPNFATWVCPSLVVAGTTGTLDASTTQNLRHASVASYVSKVKVPTLLLQGQADTLFNLNESVATFEALRRQGTPTRLVWVNGGHSGPMAPGEIDFNAPSYSSQVITKRVTDWFDHYLKGTKASTGPLFSYYRDWVTYSGSAAPAYVSSSRFPVGTSTPFYLSGSSLSRSSTGLTKASTSFLTPVAGLPTSSDPLDVVSRVAPSPLPETDLPGTAASWTSAPLASRLDVVGSPTLDLGVSAPLAVSATDPTKLTLFVKVLDVDAAGKATLVRDLVAPVRVPDATKPFRVTLPGFVHRFEKGHAVRLVVAGGSTNYRGGTLPTPVTITTGSSAQVLRLPVVP
ncbi:MAG: prolyl oligopeptidase family serine peptidase [Aeromicrobium erythreum]